MNTLPAPYRHRMSWRVVLIIGVLLAAYFAVDKISEVIADRGTRSAMEHAQERAGVATIDPQTGESRVPWQHRPMSKRRAYVVMTFVGIGLLIFSIWLDSVLG